MVVLMGDYRIIRGFSYASRRVPKGYTLLALAFGSWGIALGVIWLVVTRGGGVF